MSLRQKLEMKYSHPEPMSLPPSMEELYRKIKEEKYMIEELKALESKKDGKEDGE